jgi:AcrR family transcriptional regulator
MRWSGTCAPSSGACDRFGGALPFSYARRMDKEITTTRERNYAKTRERILLAAYHAFSEQGYAKTGIREIAKNAGVASSLLIKYFGTKSALFEEALIHAIYRFSVFARDKKNFGDIMARLMTSVGDANLTTMMVLAIADPESKDIARRVSKRHVIEPLAEWLGPPNALARAQHMYAIMAGFSIQMQTLSTDPISPATVKWLARNLQDIVDDK